MQKTIIGIVIAVAVIIPAGFIIGPYLTQSTVNEDLPENLAVPIPEEVADEMMSDDKIQDVSDEMTTDVPDTMLQDVSETMMPETEETLQDEPVTVPDVSENVPEEILDDTIENTQVSDFEDTDMAGSSEQEISDPIDVPEEMSEPIPITYAGTFIGVNDGIHNAEGKSFALPLDDGSYILRLEEFYSTNGPDLYVYLSTDKTDKDFVNLGKLKANSGNQNYEIPPDTDLSKYDTVLVWCKPFSVLFGSSEMSPQQ